MSHANTLTATRARYIEACRFLGVPYRQKDFAQLCELSPFKVSRLLSFPITDVELFNKLTYFEGDKLLAVYGSLLKRDYEALGLL